MAEPTDDALKVEAEAGQQPATPPTDEQNAKAEENQGRLIASLQEKAARVNAAEREAAEAKAEVERLRRAQSPAAPSPGVDPRQYRVREALAWAQGQKIVDGVQQGPDPVAGLAIDLATDNEMLKQQLAERDALDDIEDKALRREVKKHLNDNRNRLGDVDAALAEVQVRKLSEVQEENVRLAAALRTAQQPTGAAPPTLHREVPAQTLKARTMTQDEYTEARRGLSSIELANLEGEVGKTVHIRG